MKVFVCIANNYGISFNGRNVSRDAAVCEKILQIVKDHPLIYIGNKTGSRTEDEQLIEEVVDKDEKYPDEALYCFINGVDIEPVMDRIDTIYLIHWNRDYPADTFFHEEWLYNFLLKNTTNFEGRSHREITMEEWIRCEK